MKKGKKREHPIVEALTSVKLTIACQVLLMILVIACTLHQVELGTFGAVRVYMRPLFLYAALPGLGWKIPVFPAGGLVGLGILVNLTAVLVFRLGRARKKAGLWLIHIGLILLVTGEFVTGMFSTETRMAIEEGQTVNFTTSPSSDELILIDHSAAGYDEVHSIDESALKTGRTISDPRLPFQVRIAASYPNAKLERRPSGSDLPASKADRGFGPSLTVWPAPPVAPEAGRNARTACVELSKDGKPVGTWLVSGAIDRGQPFAHAGKRYSLALRQRRHYLPYSITLKDFRHDVYPGTQIPKNFSSLIQLRHPEKSEDREVLIYMNHPLRYEGKAFFQASYGKGDTLSILQVVENPGWLMPYVSFFLITIGLFLQFAVQMKTIKLEGAPR